MPHIDFTADKRYYNRLGSILLYPDIEPEDIEFEICDVTLNALETEETEEGDNT